jgi:hypothetical protein
MSTRHAWMVRAALCCMAFVGLWLPPGARASGAWDSFVNSTTNSVLDATKNAVNGALQPSQSPPSQSVQSGQGAQPVGPQDGALISPSTGGTLPCVSETPLGATARLVTNTCPTRVRFVQKSPASAECANTSWGPGSKQQIGVGISIIAVCRDYDQPHVILGENKLCYCKHGAIASATDTEPLPKQAAATAVGYPTDLRGCPTRKDDPRWRDVPKGKCM